MNVVSLVPSIQCLFTQLYFYSPLLFQHPHSHSHQTLTTKLNVKSSTPAINQTISSSSSSTSSSPSNIAMKPTEQQVEFCLEINQICEDYAKKIGQEHLRYKTDFCDHRSMKGKCPFGVECHFAHDVTELRPRSVHPRYKTMPCATYHGEAGVCNYGRRCNYIHGESVEELNWIKHYGQLYIVYHSFFKFSAFPPTYQQLLLLQNKVKHQQQKQQQHW